MRSKQLAVFLILMAVAFGAAARSARAPGRFFFSGDGVLTLEDAHSGERIQVRFRRPDGSYDSGALAKLKHFMRSRGDGREGDISLRLIEQIDYLEDLVRPRRLLLDSGYRSPAYNSSIRASGGRAASASLHTQGLAADLQFVGVNLHSLWLRIRKLDCCGVGYYKNGNFLHVDVGPPRFWTAATSKVDQNLSAGNARIFARTDFDRYDRLDGADVQLYSVTAFPVRVSARARFEAGDRHGRVDLAPEGDVRRDGDCLVVVRGDEHILRVVSSEAIPVGRRMRLELNTCEPRIERTPEHVETNELEVLKR
jgi:uncharacterized protein YcbK (DUF882 family)